ncbi:MAG: group II intron maturase-specific domain-containing protein [Methylococcales bacterium]
MLRGWFNYFKHVKRGELRAMDGFVRRRLRSILRKYQKQGGGTGRNIQDHQYWTNAYFASLGLFTMVEACLRKRADPDEETIDWRAVCGRTASTVRREGSR